MTKDYGFVAVEILLTKRQNGSGKGCETKVDCIISEILNHKKDKCAKNVF